MGLQFGLLMAYIDVVVIVALGSFVLAQTQMNMGVLGAFR
jgi:hypothetical protein